jgi:RNA polymerase sigma-70 factor (ECF subfamily)
MRRPEFDPNDPAFVPDPPPAPDQSMAADQAHVRVRAAFTQLSADQAAVIRLAFVEDKSHSEIAAHLKLPLGTVKSRLRLALRRLRSLLEGADV